MEMHIQPVESAQDWSAARTIRERVFIEEQNCPPQLEWDEHDLPTSECRHFVGRLEGEAVATARWRPIEFEDRPTAKLERFAVLPEHRGKGLGQKMVEAVMEDARRAGYDHLMLHAQTHVEDFYAAFGFKAGGEVFYEANIPHRLMTLGPS